MSAPRPQSPARPGATIGRLAALAVLAEAAAVGGYGVYLAVESVVAPATERGAAVVMALLCAALAAGLVVLARAVAAGRRWARAPVLVWQVLQASLAVPALSTRWPVGVGLLLLCLISAAGALRIPAEG